MLGYTIEANPDEDVDEDDNGDTPEGSEPQASPRVQSGMEEAPECTSSTENTPRQETWQTDAADVGVEHQTSDGRTGRKSYAYILLI
jgi:hypothetical protein